LWSDNSTDSIFSPTESGQVFVTVTDFNGCESFDLINLEFADCTVDVPNVFTPNGDGLNDAWFVDLDRPLFFEVVIYNRWGRIVYESNSHLLAWDGIHYKSDEPCSEGTYFFILRGLDFEGKGFEETGTITLIRE
jgi:gliding motility-associated-like protein